MASPIIHKDTLTFLKDLKKNNNRPWFQENKPRYERSLENVRGFVDYLIQKMSEVDHIETPNAKKSLHRIYRDTRFSKDKTPYKTGFMGGLKRAGSKRRGGYYFHIEPGNSVVAGGFWGPNSKDLLHIRKQIEADPDQLRSIIESERFTNAFNKLDGEKVKTAPKGFKKDHPAIDLLRYKQFLIHRKIEDTDITSKEFADTLVYYFGEMRPFFNYMSEILNTDLNGSPI